jgi:hypothetical protein
VQVVVSPPQQPAVVPARRGWATIPFSAASKSCGISWVPFNAEHGP